MHNGSTVLLVGNVMRPFNLIIKKISESANKHLQDLVLVKVVCFKPLKPKLGVACAGICHLL